MCEGLVFCWCQDTLWDNLLHSSTGSVDGEGLGESKFSGMYRLSLVERNAIDAADKMGQLVEKVLAKASSQACIVFLSLNEMQSMLLIGCSQVKPMFVITWIVATDHSGCDTIRTSKYHHLLFYQ